MLADKYFNELYHYGNSYACAARLLGADTQYFTEEQVKVKVDDTPYIPPSAFTAQRNDILMPLIEAANRQGKMFFDGQNTRLIDFYFNGDTSLELTLGRVGWFDFTVERHILERMKRIFGDYLNPDEIIYGHNLKASRLTNICSTATTPVTRDGYLMYSRRSMSVSINPGWFTAGIAENIELDKDDGSPFRTIIRGVEEELSPEISRRLTVANVNLLGIEYDLSEFTPDLLFMVRLPFTKQEIIEICDISPGPDAIEIEHYGFIIPNRGNEQIQALLSRSDWSPAGKASLIRCLEFLEATKEYG